MKLIAKKDFYNAKSLGISLDAKHDNFRHEHHVHVGARFAIGTGDNFADLSPEQKTNVMALLSTGCIAFDNDENKKLGVIEKIENEAAAHAKAHKASLSPRQTLAELVAASMAKQLPGALVEALQAAGLVKAKTA